MSGAAGRGAAGAASRGGCALCVRLAQPSPGLPLGDPGTAWPSPPSKPMHDALHSSLWHQQSDPGPFLLPILCTALGPPVSLSPKSLPALCPFSFAKHFFQISPSQQPLQILPLEQASLGNVKELNSHLSSALE